jgi:uncharacterized protein YlaI
LRRPSTATSPAPSDEYDETAWLWLGRLIEAPTDKQICFENVLTINPDNEWAAEQLRLLQRDIATAESPVPVEELLAANEAAVHEVEALVAGSAPPRRPRPERFGKMVLYGRVCPQCETKIMLHDLRGRPIQTAVCPQCASLVDVHEELAARLGRAPAYAPSQPIRLREEGTFSGQRHRVIGWVAYQLGGKEGWLWECWLLASVKGHYRWLTYDEEDGFIFYQPLSPPSDPVPATAAQFPVRHKEPVRITVVGQGRVLALAGEITWQMQGGIPIRFLDGARDGRLYRLMYTREEVELLEGVPLDEPVVWEAFGRPEVWGERQAAVRQNWLWGGGLAVLSLLLVVAAAVWSPFIWVLVLPAIVGSGVFIGRSLSE